MILLCRGYKRLRIRVYSIGLSLELYIFQLVLQAFFDRSLQPYFASSMSPRYLLNPSSTRRRRLLGALNELDRYLDSSVLTVSKRLAALIRHRDDLDYQHAMQFRLRGWVVFHAGLSLVLLVWSFVHAFIAIGMLGN